jgi:thymidylate synthase (FAD)
VSERSEDGRTFNYIIPESIKALGQPYIDKFKQQMATIQSWYDEWVQLLGNKGEASNQDARFVLPNAAETKFLVTMNARELLHFFSLRCCNRAQWEIRNLAKEMLKLVLQVAPNIFMNAGPGCIRGACPEGEMTCGRASEVRREFEEIYREYGGLK